MFPDYYRILDISPKSTLDEVRQAYRKQSLKTHPDRQVKATPEQLKSATEHFQAVADAYFVLSDPQRRKEYDILYSSHPDRSTDPKASTGFFSQFADIFTGGGGGSGSAEPDAGGIFADVFDDLLRPEVERHAPWWAYIGAACGAGMGFIIANVPGLMLGAYAGNRLGAVRDAKGQSVAAVFNQLGSSRKAEILRALALKVLGSAL